MILHQAAEEKNRSECQIYNTFNINMMDEEILREREKKKES